MLENEDLRISVIKKLKETKTLQNDKMKYRNLFFYNMEKIKNEHLEKKNDQNKINDIFSISGKLNKTIDAMTLTSHLKNFLNESNLGKILNKKID